MLRYITHARRTGHATARALAAAALGLVVLGGCSNITDPLLEAVDPDILGPENIDSPAGSVALYRGSILRLNNIAAGSESTWLFGGLLADEFGTGSTFVQNDEADLRRVQTNNSSITGMFRRLNQVRTAANQGLAGYAEWFPDSTTTPAEMYFARGFAEMQLAQDFCSAIPLSDGADAVPVLSGPLTTTEVFERAVASYDSALSRVGTATTPARVVSIARAARVGRARALLGLGRFAEAGALVTEALVPTTFTYDQTFALTSGDNIIWSQVPSQRRYLVGDSIEGNSRNIPVRNNLPFFSARDPRLPANFTIATNAAGRADTTRSQDGSTLSRTMTLYARQTIIPIVSGIDARLVQAEAALQANNPTEMLAILNRLRSAGLKIGEVQLTATSLPALALPATRDAQVNLLFREKAFWTYSRGQRLGDLRRLIRQYGRTQENVFPQGTHYRGSVYGTDVNFAIPQEEDTNVEFGPEGRAACRTDQA